MSELIIKSASTIGKVPDYKGNEFGKIQISSKRLAKYVGQKLFVTVSIDIPDEE